MTVASAQCAKTATAFPLNGSDFGADYNFTASNATRACFQIGNGRTCDVDAGLCCLGENTRGLPKYTSVTFRLSNGTGCLPDPATLKKTVKWSANGKAKKAKIVGANVTVTVGLLAATPVTLCADFLPAFNQNCTGMAKLCDGTTCKVSLQLSKVTKKPDALNQTTWTTGVSCCLSGQADLRTCDVGSQQGCAANATCNATVVEGASRGVCTCPTGYEGDPYTKCTDKDECATDNGGCHKAATCTNTGGGRVCQCNGGYTGDGFICTDVNECLTGNGGCHPESACANSEGSRTCTCKPGYTGDGILICTDVNECAANNGGCDANAVCNNTAGGRTCTCKKGFAGSGTSCTDLGPCGIDNGGCDANAVCNNTAGGFTCTCKAGYAGNGTSCTDLGPRACQLGTDNCHPNATCTDTIGGFNCTCKAGFVGDGVTSCTEDTACSTGAANCNANATCSAAIGGHACTCKPGYSGDGVTSCVKASVRCWSATDDPAVTTVPADLGDVLVVAASRGEQSFTCAIRADDSRVQCWGRNDGLQLDVPPDLGLVVQLSISDDTPCALTILGAVRCWGPGSAVSLLPSDLTSLMSTNALSLGTDYGCAVTADKALKIWGGDGTPEVDPFYLLLNTVSTVACGGGQVCFFLDDRFGKLFCVGNGTYGQSPVPDDISGETFSAVSAGEVHTCALSLGGTLYCFGQLDPDGVFVLPVPGYVPDGLGPVKMATTGYRSTTGVVTESGALRMLPEAPASPGSRTAVDLFGPTPADLGPVLSVTLGYSHACAILAD